MIKSREIKRFHPSRQALAEIMLATKPSGTMLAKFHGEPVLIPAVAQGEKPFGNSRFTPRQLDALISYEQHRRQKIVYQVD